MNQTDKIRVGCSGWFYRHWRGRFYPEDLPTHRWFQFYATQFDCVEINASFYRFPTEERVRAWMRGAPQGFQFAVKAPRLITHIRAFRNCEEPIQRFLEVLAPLKEAGMLGPVLFQLPPRIRFDLSFLDHMLLLLPLTQLRCAIEFRHSSWWNDEAIDRICAAGAIFCTVSSPAMPDAFISCHGSAYVRLHGRPTHANHYSDEELTQLAENLRQLNKGWVFFNNDGNAAAPADAKTLLRLLSE